MAAGWVATFLYDRAGGQWEANIFLVLLISDCSGGLAGWLVGLIVTLLIFMLLLWPLYQLHYPDHY